MIVMCREADGRRHRPSLPQALLPGSFNPLHDGHLQLAAVATVRLGVAVAFELSTHNVDKPPLSDDEVERRLVQFTMAPVWVTHAPRFLQKAKLFPGVTFVVGYDTAIRLIDPKYYADDVDARDAALRQLREWGCRYLVAGRLHREVFEVWQPSLVAAEFRNLFLALGAAEFRVDCSSTLLRTSDTRLGYFQQGT
jgi:Cytidylyltransferase-like